MDEAKIDDTPYGRNPADEGWFVLNLGDALAVQNEKGGATYPLEPDGGPFTGFGVNVQVLWPGQPNGLYHSENMREAFLVLFGECKLLVEEQERPLRQWDFVHCPAGTGHIFVGTGSGPCSILMIGARTEDATINYPVSELAARYDASTAKETPHPNEAYADWPGDFAPTRLPWPVE
jgi:uncharacterized cupin superfamily protein